MRIGGTRQLLCLICCQPIAYSFYPVGGPPGRPCWVSWWLVSLRGGGVERCICIFAVNICARSCTASCIR